MVRKSGRHTAAFLLLFLAKSPAYGNQLLSQMQRKLPFCLADSASVYRTLQEMEDNGWVETRWESCPTGQPRKWYHITVTGRKALETEALDIRQRLANFEYFLHQYANFGPGDPGGPGR